MCDDNCGLSERLEGVFESSRVTPHGSLKKSASGKALGADGVGTRLSVLDLITSPWKASVSLAPHRGRATLAYLQDHPDDDSVHVVL
jgi:hypothetical protein